MSLSGVGGIGSAVGGLVGLGSAIGGGILSADAADRQSDLQARSYQFKAQDDVYTGQSALRSARSIRDLLPIELQQQQEDFDKQIGVIRANYGASGLDMEGTPLEVLKSTVRDQTFSKAMTVFGANTQIQDLHDKARQAFRSAKINNANAQDAQGGDFYSSLGAAFGVASSVTGNSLTRGLFGVK